uniref:Uncharacterized protein n=1 Tax=Romanomermis culicivorax TaxID=13658 RepID=A0A915JS49_ROMCU
MRVGSEMKSTTKNPCREKRDEGRMTRRVDAKKSKKFGNFKFKRNMAMSGIVETDNIFGQPQDCQDNTSFLISNYNVHPLVRSTDIFNYFTSLFRGPHRAIEDPMFLASKNIKAFNKAMNLSKFRGRVIYGTIFCQDNIIVGFHIREDITLVLTKFSYLDQEKELAPKRRDNMDYILSCCVHDLEIILAEMKDKLKMRMVGISSEALSLKALMTELMDADKLNMEVLRYATLYTRGSLLCFLALLQYGFAADILNCFQLYAHDTMEPELVADLARRFGETFKDKYTHQQWKGAYEVEEMMDNMNALYIMMRVEAIGTYKLAEEQAPGTFYCPPHFSNMDIEPQPVPGGWYSWIERKVKQSITTSRR